MEQGKCLLPLGCSRRRPCGSCVCAGSEPHPTQHHVRVCPWAQHQVPSTLIATVREQPRSLPRLSTQDSLAQTPQNGQLPLPAPASLATARGEDSLRIHRWVPIPPEAKLYPLGFSLLHPSVGRGLPPAAGPAVTAGGWQASSSSSSGIVAVPPRAPMVAPRAGAAARAPGTAQSRASTSASRRGLQLLQYLMKGS